jgi:predicted nucleic acid-binding protein
MIAFLDAEPGSVVVEELLLDTTNVCYAHAINLFEVFYHVLRKSNEATARQAIEDLLFFGVVLREDMDTPFWQEAGRLKVAHSLSVADTFCLTLGRRLGSTVVTTDHHEMDVLVPLGLCPIQFIR